MCGKKVWKATLQESGILALPRAGRGMGQGDTTGADGPSGAVLTHPTTSCLPSPCQSPSSATWTKWRIRSVFLICIHDTPGDTAGLAAIMKRGVGGGGVGRERIEQTKHFLFVLFYFQA